MRTAARTETGRASLIIRLKSIEGQARGIQRMLDEDRNCREIIDQLIALRSASHAVTMHALADLAQQCLREWPDAPERVIAEVVETVSRALR